ncbi:MAG: ShlB/FhaC/HecB family hemolysin secretion/activation protein [Hellea sp.]|nr:ShlB/FhaC/HecB family hemolysin secretion/activation protein [Hellea sp.]
MFSNTIKSLSKSVSAIVIAVVVGTSMASQTASGQTRNEIELPETEELRTGSVNVSIEQRAIERENCPFDGSDLTTNLHTVTFSSIGGEVLPASLMNSLSGVSVQSGTKALSVVCDIRDEANRALRRDGWIASVQIPQQELQNELSLQIIYARISEIRVMGDPGPYRDILTKRLQVLKEMDPLNEKDAERILLNISDIPGLEVRLGLAPDGGRPGEVIGNLTVTHEPYAFYLNARNYNAQRIGRETVYGRFEYYGLTGMGDVSYVGAQATADFQEQVIVQAGHEFAIPGTDVRLAGNATYAKSKPDLGDLDLDTQALQFNINASYPLMRTPRRRATVSGGFDYVDQTTDIGPFTLSKDSLRTLYLRGEFSGEQRRLNGAVTAAFDSFLEIRQGLNVFDATSPGQFGTSVTSGIPASRPFGVADALVVRGMADIFAPVTRQIGVNARVEGQWTNDPLLNFDEYSIGNLSIGRGYDPGANSGDRAIGGAFELRATVIEKPKYDIEIFGFYDVVKTENLDAFTPEPTRVLESIGGGLRFSFNDSVRAELTYASPMDRAIFSDDVKPPDRVLFSITTKFPSILR